MVPSKPFEQYTFLYVTLKKSKETLKQEIKNEKYNKSPGEATLFFLLFFNLFLSQGLFKLMLTH